MTSDEAAVILATFADSAASRLREAINTILAERRKLLACEKPPPRL